MRASGGKPAMHRAGLASAGATALVTSMQTPRPIPSITSLPTLNLRGHHQAPMQLHFSWRVFWCLFYNPISNYFPAGLFYPTSCSPSTCRPAFPVAETIHLLHECSTFSAKYYYIILNYFWDDFTFRKCPQTWPHLGNRQHGLAQHICVQVCSGRGRQGCANPPARPQHQGPEPGMPRLWEWKTDVPLSLCRFLPKTRWGQQRETAPHSAFSRQTGCPACLNSVSCAISGSPKSKFSGFPGNFHVDLCVPLSLHSEVSQGLHFSPKRRRGGPGLAYWEQGCWHVGVMNNTILVSIFQEDLRTSLTIQL